MEIKTKHLTLIPVPISAKGLFYHLACKTDAKNFLYGKEVPSRIEFFKDYKDFYFKNQQSRYGRCYFITKGREIIGQISSNKIEKTELNLMSGLDIKEMGTNVMAQKRSKRLLKIYLIILYYI